MKTIFKSVKFGTNYFNKMCLTTALTAPVAVLKKYVAIAFKMRFDQKNTIFNLVKVSNFKNS